MMLYQIWECHSNGTCAKISFMPASYMHTDFFKSHYCKLDAKALLDITEEVHICVVGERGMKSQQSDLTNQAIPSDKGPKT